MTTLISSDAPSLGVTVRTDVDPATRDALYRSAPDAAPSHSPQWLDVVIGHGAWRDASRLYEFDDGVRALLPLVRSRSVPRPMATAASLPPGWGFGGIVTTDGFSDLHQRLVWDDLVGLGHVRLRIRPNPLEGDRWARTRPSSAIAIARRAHVLDLRGGFDEVWTQRVHSATRSNVRRAERLGVEVTCGSDERHLAAYRHLLTRSRRRWAKAHREPLWLAAWRAERRDPTGRIEAMVRAAGVSRLWIAWHEGRPAAGIVVLLGTNAHYTRGAMDREVAATTRANDLLQRVAIEAACDLGCRWYHMGESGSSRSLAHFKERLGAAPHDHEEYLLERVPLHRIDTTARELVKRTIGYRDV